MSKIMENQKDALLMKSRSSSACIKEGFGRFMGNFKWLVANSWPVALVYAIICGALCTACVVHIPAMTVQTVQSQGNLYPVVVGNLPFIGLCAALVVLGGVFEAATYSCALSRLKAGEGQSVALRKFWRLGFDVRTFVRTLKAAVVNVAAWAVVAAAAGAVVSLGSAMGVGGRRLVMAAAAVVAVAAAVAVLLPLALSSLKYVFCEGEKLFPTIFRHHSVGLRHVGFMLIVVVVCAIVVGFAEYILTLPAVVLSVANFQANAGVLNGDPLAIPGLVNYISAVVFLFAGFVQVYVRMSAIFPLCYMYGSVETQEEEKQKFKKSSAMQPQTSLMR